MVAPIVLSSQPEEKILFLSLIPCTEIDVRGLRGGEGVGQNPELTACPLDNNTASHTGLYRHTHTLYFPVLVCMRCAGNTGFYCDGIQIVVQGKRDRDAKCIKTSPPHLDSTLSLPVTTRHMTLTDWATKDLMHQHCSNWQRLINCNISNNE